MIGEGSAKKLMILGIDGMDPRLTKRFLDEGVLPNLEKFLAKGSAREDVGMMGAVPTITPPMWTTLSTGAYPSTHGITCFWRQSPDNLESLQYNLDSRLSKAEPLWNVFVEAGKKTLVWHWPGSSWPPTSQSPLLHVVDGTQPSVVNAAVASRDKEFILAANVKTTEVTFREKAATDSNVPCVIDDLVPEQDYTDLGAMAFSRGDTTNIILSEMDGEATLTDTPYDVVLSPIKPATGWASAPKGAKEFTMLLSHGYLRRPCLILQNNQGVYDHVAIYKNKKDTAPLATLQNNVFVAQVFDEAVFGDARCDVMRSMRVLHLAEDGSALTIWVSTAVEPYVDTLWHPHYLNKLVVDNVGVPTIISMLGGADERLIRDCMHEAWERNLEWQAEALNYLIVKEGYEAIFSHWHNIDAQGHMIVKYLKKGHKKMSGSQYFDLFRLAYTQADRYIGKFLHLIDQGWTIMIVSDHGQVCPSYTVPMLSETSGVNVRVMEELGFTHIQHDENGNELKEIDWARTKAVATRGTHIYLNVKDRDKHGIVDPMDKFEVEEEIITALYGYRSKESGKRMVALALRNKDAIALGHGGPESGDIIYFLAEGYTYDHGDSLSTTYGEGGTSVAPVFAAAGPGIKKDYKTNRVIRQVDVAATMALLGGVRMPRECEGSPIYQIME